MGHDVFISYSRGDGVIVERLDALLRDASVDTWFDRRNLLPGQKWENVIEDEIPAARVFLTCLSATALDDRGYFHAEQQFALKAAMRIPSDQLFIIPVLLGECSLTRELRQYHSVNLGEPLAIESLLSSLSKALERTIDVAPEAIAEFRDSVRKHLSTGEAQFGAGEFSDKDVIDVVMRLRKLHQDHGTEILPWRELLPELDLLFNRKTFRFEALRGCPEQRWADRVDSAYQTLTVLQGYVRNVRDTAPEKYPTYRDLVMEVDKYCMQMGALLFERGVDYNEIEAHIGRATFKAHLPKEIRFPVGPDKQPQIPDDINDKIERHRARAVELMDHLVGDPGIEDRKCAVEKAEQELLEFSGIRLYPSNQPQESKSWREIGDRKFQRNYEVDADPVFEIMLKNTGSDSVIPYRVGIHILQRIAGTGGTMGYSQPIEVQSEFTIHCPEGWKQTWGIIEETAWAEFEHPIEMKKGDSPFRFTLMLENLSDPDRASSCEVRFYLVTDKGTAESRSIWLSQ